MTVRISLLGGFEVQVDGVPVPSQAWSRRSAASLVKLLALADARRLHREQVVEALWPGTPWDAAAPRLHKAAQRPAQWCCATRWWRCSRTPR